MKDLPRIILTAIISSFLTVLIMTGDFSQLGDRTPEGLPDAPVISQEENKDHSTIDVVKSASPAVVSIIATKEVPIYETFQSEPSDPFDSFKLDPFDFFNQRRIERRPTGKTERQEIGGGTGFVVGDNMLITNKHVVEDTEAKYFIIESDGEEIEAEVIARDPVYDIALLKAELGIKALRLGDSDSLEVGQTVVTIGNALGEFSNTVSVGVVSGLERTIAADLRSLIQTDAAINRGNSGGPLLNLRGEVVGINTAIASSGQNIGFAIPINAAKKAINDVLTKGKIEYAFLGVEYNINDHSIMRVVAKSPAEVAGLKAGDIILELNHILLSEEKTLTEVITDLNPGEKIKIVIKRNGEEKILEAILDTR